MSTAVKLALFLIMPYFGTVQGKLSSTAYVKTLPIDSGEVILTESVPHHSSEQTGLNPMSMCAMLGFQDSVSRMAFNVNGSHCIFARTKLPLFKQIFLPPENLTMLANRDDVFYYSDACESTIHGMLNGFHANLLEDEPAFGLRMKGNIAHSEVTEPEVSMALYDSSFPVPVDSRSIHGQQLAMKFDTTNYIKYTLESPLTFATNEMTIMVEFFRDSVDRQSIEGLMSMKMSGTTFDETGLRFNLGHNVGAFYPKRPTVRAKELSEKRYSELHSYDGWYDIVFIYQPGADSMRLWLTGFSNTYGKTLGVGGALWPVDEIYIGKADDVFGKIMVSQITILETAILDVAEIKDNLAKRKNYKYSSHCKP